MVQDVVTNRSPERIWGEKRAWKGEEMKLEFNVLDLFCYLVRLVLTVDKVRLEIYILFRKYIVCMP